MCSEGTARWFRQSYPIIGMLSTLACLYVVSTAPALHAEFFSTTVTPINGTLQILHCVEDPSQLIIINPLLPPCTREVDKDNRLKIEIYHLSMGLPFLLCCFVGSIFCVLAKKEESHVFSMDTLFIPETYAPSHPGVCVCHHLLKLVCKIDLQIKNRRKYIIPLHPGAHFLGICNPRPFDIDNSPHKSRGRIRHCNFIGFHCFLLGILVQTKRVGECQCILTRYF